MTKNVYMGRRPKGYLSNRMDGNGTNDFVSNAITDHFQLVFDNTTTQVIKLAIVPSYLNTIGIDVTPGGPELHFHNPEPLRNAGQLVDVIADDAEVAVGAGKVIMHSGDSTKKIRDFLDYIKTNPSYLVEMSLMTTDTNAYNANMELSDLNPFNKTGTRSVDLQKFFDRYQFQDGKINAQFDVPLLVNDTLLWTINIPANTKITMILRFRAPEV